MLKKETFVREEEFKSYPFTVPSQSELWLPRPLKVNLSLTHTHRERLTSESGCLSKTQPLIGLFASDFNLSATPVLVLDLSCSKWLENIMELFM